MKSLNPNTREPVFKQIDKYLDELDKVTRKEFEKAFDEVLNGRNVDDVAFELNKRIKTLPQYKNARKAVRDEFDDNINQTFGYFKEIGKSVDIGFPSFVLTARLNNALKTNDKVFLSALDRYNRQFMSIADEAMTSVTTGENAISGATKVFREELQRQGVTKVTLSDGRKMNSSAYIKMYIRSEHNRIDGQNMNDVMDTFDLDVFLISTHTHREAREGCKPYEHWLVSRSGNTKQIEDIDGTMQTVHALSDTSYGQASGIFGINCTHSRSPVVPGLFEYGSKPSLKVSKRKK